MLTVLSAVLVDFLLLGFAIATACWWVWVCGRPPAAGGPHSPDLLGNALHRLIANRFLRKKAHVYQVEQHVEW